MAEEEIMAEEVAPTLAANPIVNNSIATTRELTEKIKPTEAELIDPTHPVIRQVLSLKPTRRRPENLQRLLQALDAGILNRKAAPPCG